MIGAQSQLCCISAIFSAQPLLPKAAGCSMFFRTSFVSLCAGVMVAQTVVAAPLLGEKQQVELLDAQNTYRVELGEPALAWSDKLAASAQSWAEHLANEVHAMKHSGAIATGENIAMSWPPGHASLTRMVEMWGDEKWYFVDAVFPDVSWTGNWETVAHYSQLVWRKTTDVGCGFATGGGQDYLVCQYNPAGNFIGEKAF